MKIRIIHTADNHIGMNFSSRPYIDDVRNALLEERFTALERTVQLANERKAHFLVVAGDLFHTTSVSTSTVKRTAQILSGFTEGTLLVLPGNHDFYDGSKTGIWETFRRNYTEDNLLMLTDCSTQTVEIEDKTIHFYAAPCDAKTSKTNKIGWVKDVEKLKEHIHIGVAHGSVLGKSPDMKNEYFVMSEAELKESGVDFWLLGHIHVRYPEQPTTHNPLFFYPATPTPDGFDSRHEGFVWYLEVDEKKKLKMESVKTGGMRFYELERAVKSIEDISALKNEITAMQPQQSLIKLKLEGRLTEQDKLELQKAITDVKQQVKHLEVFDEDVKLNITKTYIDENYRPNSLPYRLLSSLSENEDDNLALQLANEMIEKLKTN